MGPTSASPNTTSGVVPGAVAPGNNPPISNTPIGLVVDSRHRQQSGTYGEESKIIPVCGWRHAQECRAFLRRSVPGTAALAASANGWPVSLKIWMLPM
jgi:hypothetical protein